MAKIILTRSWKNGTDEPVLVNTKYIVSACPAPQSAHSIVHVEYLHHPYWVNETVHEIDKIISRAENPENKES